METTSSKKEVDVNEIKHDKEKKIESNIKEEGFFSDHKPIPINIINKALKSICKITIRQKKRIIYGTGFFMKIDNSKKYLITNYHIISKETINENIELEIYNGKKMKIILNNRYIKFYPKEKDITIIEIKSYDQIYNDIELLNYDLNYKNGYEIYKNVDIFSIEHPLGESASCASGKIIYINNYEFRHNIPTDNSSSGCPIILLNKNINIIQVIGIHKLADYSEKLNCGTFIGEIFNEDLNNNNYNFIIGEITINESDVNKNIQIINTFDNYKKINNNYICKEDDYKRENEKEIKENIEIKINEKKIEFTYKYKFEKKGKYKIEYLFKNNLLKTNYMFFECCSLTNLDFSNFNTQKVTDMSNMFSHCSSLTNLNLSNFDTQNVNDMSEMFHECYSLTNLNISNFNTKNVTDMKYMFFDCCSLTNLDLSNFNTQNVKNMESMFRFCRSLKNLNLANFNTQKCFKYERYVF